MFVFRINVEMERRQEELRALQQVPAQIMGQVYNPFVLQLQHPHTACMKGECILLPVIGKKPLIMLLQVSGYGRLLVITVGKHVGVGRFYLCMVTW